MDNIGRVSAEVLGILEYYPEEQQKKIPKELIEKLREASLPQEACEIDPTKRIEEQAVSPDTITLFGMIYREYLATPEEKQELNRKIAEFNCDTFDAKNMFEKLTNGG